MIDSVLSVDLGRSKDPTALIHLDRHGRSGAALTIRQISTFRPREPAERLYRLQDKGPSCLIVVDATGPHRQTGLDIARSFLVNSPVVLLQIRGEAAQSEDPRVLCVPKPDLVEALLDGLARKLVICPRGLDGAEELALQLEHYRRTNPEAEPHVKPRYAAEPGYHDDLVMALAQALWIRPRLGKLGTPELPVANGGPACL